MLEGSFYFFSIGKNIPHVVTANFETHCHSQMSEMLQQLSQFSIPFFRRKFHHFGLIILFPSSATAPRSANDFDDLLGNSPTEGGEVFPCINFLRGFIILCSKTLKSLPFENRMGEISHSFV